jgi:hypothetical protein
MSRWIAVALGGVFLALSCASAQQQTAAPRQVTQSQAVQTQAVPVQSDAIMIGQSMYDVVAIMKKHGKSPGAGFQVARQGEGAEEIKHISCVLDEKQAIAAICYKAGTEHVTSLSVVFSHRSQFTGRADQIWVSVRKITFHADGSHSLQFEAPAK